MVLIFSKAVTLGEPVEPTEDIVEDRDDQRRRRVCRNENGVKSTTSANRIVTSS